MLRTQLELPILMTRAASARSTGDSTTDCPFQVAMNVSIMISLWKINIKHVRIVHTT